jgi:hypothetical protein
MVRTQLFLDNAMHLRLRTLARQQGRTVSELVREALERTFGAGTIEERRRTRCAVMGIWRDRKDLGSTREYVRRLRRDTHRVARRKH